ncbi:MalY/PatB family protein [Cellulosilyticum lentocellum]|uniref:cysteine-S-conjugate beta-lyase n=1 Tax=Cellulosilyticum lentocellum (strain ATCC 49066 / DSM 5427 / NCIMB 11756 / RHM5) TaxID=642492 RepID=F2JLC3_CELLD|nr:Cystathionine beta-lyase [Cellulosilyticum lentocellum DSM 5427]
MSYSFNEIIPRKGTNSLKYDFTEERGKPKDILPLWIADMDFKVPEVVSKRLNELAAHGIFGYSEVGTSYFEAVSNWMATYHNWKVKEEWLIKAPGVVFAIAMAIRALTKEGDSILIQQPVYHPFSKMILNNDRKLVSNTLIYQDGRYSIDFDDFEKKIVEHQVKLFILCNPHNPVGRVWTKEELIKLGDICLKHQILVVSDEIHQDFIYQGYKHEVFMNLNKAYEEITITCTAPSKTFNLAGLQVSNIFIANASVRRKVRKEIARIGYSQLNSAGLVACEAAYTEGREWLEALKTYLMGNLEYLRKFIETKLPEIKLVEPEGTYLVWLDFNALGLKEEALEEFIVKKANLWLNSGSTFGESGQGFERINIACPREILNQALEQLWTSIKALRV